MLTLTSCSILSLLYEVVPVVALAARSLLHTALVLVHGHLHIVHGHVGNLRLVVKRSRYGVPHLLVNDRELHPAVVFQQRDYRFSHLCEKRLGFELTSWYFCEVLFVNLKFRLCRITHRNLTLFKWIEERKVEFFMRICHNNDHGTMAPSTSGNHVQCVR